MYIRKNVFDLGGDWGDTILWYARGVAEMKKLALDKPTGWAFYAAIHGFDSKIWPKVHLPITPLPSKQLQGLYWAQCQHGSWFFLPWHRGYLLAIEKILRKHIVDLGGPSDWALPYWNYFKNQQGGKAPLPPAFASPDWPDGKGNNPLYVLERYGPQNNGNVYVPVNQINLDALSDPDFTGVATGGSPGFGGVDTGFSHSGSVHGGIETQPHDYVHGLVGGSKGRLPGLMSDPDTAGYDPIFWLHHANIDRLWQVWNLNPPSHVDPSQPTWKQGPQPPQRIFALPNPDGTEWKYTPEQMSDMASLGYTYDDLSATAALTTLSSRLTTLGLTAEAAASQGASLNTGHNVELVGASNTSLNLEGTGAQVTVQLAPAPRAKVAHSLVASAAPAPDRVFLNLENVQASNDATAFQVYVGLPKGAKPEDHPELLAGGIALFGARKASDPDGEHGGKGLTYVLEISKIVDQLHLKNSLDVDHLDVQLVPVNPVAKEDNVRIGRISIYRQGK
jgi:tyrosinase